MFLNYRSVSKVNDEWFADEENVRKAVGLLENHIPLPDAKEVINPSRGICIIDWDVVIVMLQWILLAIISCTTYFSSPPAANLWNLL